LWRANEENRCYDLVSIAGICSTIGTMGSVVGMVWYNRGNNPLTDCDARLWFLMGCCGVACLVYLSETQSDIIPKAPYRKDGVKCNIWVTDDFRLAVPLTPLYILPLLRGWVENRGAVDRFSRWLFQIINATFVSFAIAVAMNFAAWGSIWCLFCSFLLVVFDVHLVLDIIENRKHVPCNHGAPSTSTKNGTDGNALSEDA
jgi:hypothetical protein